MSLDEYNEKRDFKKTSEPRGSKSKSHKKLKFVVQHHLARREHYDLRLEYDGVYKSFAIPKGPSFNTNDKRLAVQVEDHPLSYGNFEGVIPKGEYGAGTVMLFDKGYYEPYKTPNFVNGPVKFRLYGERLKGTWALIHFKDDNWLMIKEVDEYVGDVDISKYDTSIKTGRTIEEIGSDMEKIEITHPDKVIIKNGMVTKNDLVEYYKKVASRMMPYLDNRLISTIRCPSGNEKFFMKHFNNKYLGKKIIKDFSDEAKNDYNYIKDINGLIYEVEMNSYEFHVWGSLQNRVKKPDMLVFDLDPDEGLDIKVVRDGARDLKSILDELGLRSFLKTSGGKGYHIVVPINLTSWKKAEEFSSKIAMVMVDKWPDKYTVNIRKEKRKGKIFIDYLRNKFGATSVCPYSVRLRDNASVSFPISWKDLNKIKPDDITLKNIDKYLKKDDAWSDFFESYN